SEQDSTIPAESIVDGKDLTTPVQEEFSTTTVDKIKQDDILETPPSPGSLQNPPPPYSQWDQLSLEQLLEKSKEVLTMTNGGEQKDGKMLDKVRSPPRVRANNFHTLMAFAFLFSLAKYFDDREKSRLEIFKRTNDVILP
ncbi:224_t:CDS:1, partial [Racocetra persica]